MKLIGSETSPFTRLVRVVGAELGVAFEFDLTPPFAKMTVDQDKMIGSYNPLHKVPVLVDGVTTVIDSRVIVTYLMKQASRQGDFRTGFPKDMTEENIMTVIWGVLDAGILRYVMKTAHPESGWIRVSWRVAWIRLKMGFCGWTSAVTWAKALA